MEKIEFEEIVKEQGAIPTDKQGRGTLGSYETIYNWNGYEIQFTGIEGAFIRGKFPSELAKIFYEKYQDSRIGLFISGFPNDYLDYKEHLTDTIYEESVSKLFAIADKLEYKDYFARLMKLKDELAARDDKYKYLVEYIADKPAGFRAFFEEVKKYDLSKGFAKGDGNPICEAQGHDYGAWSRYGWVETERREIEPGKFVDVPNVIHEWSKVCSRCGAEIKTSIEPEEFASVRIRKASKIDFYYGHDSNKS